MQYRDGQIYLAQASTIVEGVDTEFLEYCKAGDRLFIRDESVSYVIEEILTNEKLRLSAPYRKTSKQTSYSVQLDYSVHFRLLMPYLGDFNVEDMLRLNIGKLDAMLAAACAGAGEGNPYTLELVSLIVQDGNSVTSRVARVTINASHAQAATIKILLDSNIIVDWTPVIGEAFEHIYSALSTGNHVATAEIKDEKGNHKSASFSFTVGDAGGGGGDGLSPNNGAWTFTPSAGVGGRVASIENNVIVGMALIHGGASQQPWSTQKAALLVPTGEVLATEGTDFPGYPVSVKIWNLTRQEVWRWDSATAAAVLEVGGGSGGAGGFSVTADPDPATLDGSEYKTGWTATATEPGVTVTGEVFYWDNWQTWYSPQISLNENAPVLSGAFWGGMAAAGSFPLKYRLKNASKTVTIEYPTTTAAAVITEEIHGGGVANPDAITEITAITQVADTQNATLEFKVLSNHSSLATEWQVEVDGVATTAWVAAAFNQQSTVIHTLVNLAVGTRSIVLRGRGSSVTDNEKTTTIDITSSSTTIPAPDLSAFAITPGQGEATFALTIADALPVKYTIFRDGVEIKAAGAFAVLTSINETVSNIPAGSGLFYIRVTNDANQQSATAHVSADIAAPDAGAAVITAMASALTSSAGVESVSITALVDVPNGSWGIHYRVYRYLTGGAVTPEAERGGFEWIAHPADFSPGAIEVFYTHDTANYTYALDARPQDATAFSTASIDVPGQSAAGSLTITLDSVATVDGTSYTINATLSNTLSEAQEYRIVEDGTEKVGWTALANGAQLSETITATAATYSVDIEGRSASIAATSINTSVVVSAATGGTDVGIGQTLVRDDLTITINSVDWPANNSPVNYTATLATAGTLWIAKQPPWSTDFGTAYDSPIGTHNQDMYNGSTGDIVRMRFEHRDAGGAVLTTIDTVDLVHP